MPTGVYKHKNLSKETKRKISIALKGKPAPWKYNSVSQKTKKKLSIIAKQKGFGNWMKGKKFTKQWKENMSKALLGKKHKPMSLKGRKNMSIAQIGKKHSQEHKNKISQTIKNRNLRGEKHWKWKGGRAIVGGGYILIYKPEHPFCSKRGYILEHRLVMEKILGRYLKSTEIVHHINGIKNDNRSNNLTLCMFNKHWHPCVCPKCRFEFLIK